MICVLLILAAAPAAASAMPRLHAVRGSSPAIATSDGRDVLLRGVNVNQLGDYWQQRSDIPATLPLSEDDFAGIHALGMNVVRLIVHWSKLEPERGRFDDSYIAQIAQAVHWARDNGIYVVLDMHQDAWGKYIASPKSETCLAGFSHQQGWDGAPAWATITDGLPTCRFQIREVAPAVAQAWQNFYLDRDGIQAELVRTWAHLARAFAADPTVAGYDLLNEPNPGYGVGAEDATTLGLYYKRAIGALRAAERSVRGGFAHIVFFEPSVIWSAAAVDATPPAALVDDPNVVFAPHLYGESISADRSVGPGVITVEQGFQFAQLAAAQYGSTVWSGEWGWFGDPRSDAPAITRYAKQEDAHLWGGAWWDWKQSCGDPHMFGDGDSTTPGAVSQSLNRFGCPGNVPLGIPPTTKAILSRPYVRVGPGLQSMSSDPAGPSLDASGSGRGRLQAWFPGAAAPRVATTGLRRVSAAATNGGWIVSGSAGGEWHLTLRRA